MAANRIRLKYLAESGDKTAETVKRIISNPDRLLGVLLLGNTVANIGAASLVTYLVAEYLPDHAEKVSVVASILLAVVILIFCELTPKIVAATHSERVARRLVIPIGLSLRLLGPFARLAAWCANRIVRLTGLSADASPFSHALSRDEIRAIIEGSTAAGMAEDKKEMLHNVFQIGATQVREVMIPRVEVTAVDIAESLPDILSVVVNTQFSRIPVYRGKFDNMVGVLYVKDLLRSLQKPGDINLQVLLRPVQYIPDRATIESALRQFQSMHLHLAVVVDEFGGVEGIVTLEDLIEEIVGDISDEHDTETDSVRELGPELYSISGNLPVKEFNRIFERKIPESREYTTIVGFLQTRTGRLLHEGETVRFQDLSFSIEKTDGFRVISVRVRASKPAAAQPARLEDSKPLRLQNSSTERKRG
jgi:putative hemolysin